MHKCQMDTCTNVECTNAKCYNMHKCYMPSVKMPNAQTSKCQMDKCTNAQMDKCTNAQMPNVEWVSFCFWSGQTRAASSSSKTPRPQARQGPTGHSVGLDVTNKLKFTVSSVVFLRTVTTNNNDNSAQMS